MQRLVRAERPANHRSAHAARLSTLGSLAESLTRHIRTWRDRMRQRRALAAVDDWLLKDIGVSRADAMCEGDKAFWQE